MEQRTAAALPQKQNPFLSLVGWNWQLIRLPFFIICIVMAVAELALLLFAAGHEINLGVPLHALFEGGGAMAAFPLAYLAVLAVGLRPALQLTGKTKGGYTLLTLPHRRATLLGAHCASVMIALLGLMAWQVLLIVLYYFPVTALSDSVAAGKVAGVALEYTGRIFRTMKRNELLLILLPARWETAVALVLFVVCPAVLVCCAAYHKPVGRAVSAMLVLAGMAASYVMVLEIWTINQQRWLYDNIYGLTGYYLWSVILAALALAAWLWALHSVCRANFL